MTERAAADPALVLRCVGGEADAWRTLVEAYSPLVWSVARRSGISPEDVADVYQTVWKIAVEQLHRLRDPARLGIWIGRITHFQSMRVLRGYYLTRRAMDRLQPDEETSETPDQQIAALERRRTVHAAKARIGDRCRLLLEQLYYESPSPSYAEISARLDMPIGSIGPTRARCLKKLERELKRSCDADPA